VAFPFRQILVIRLDRLSLDPGNSFRTVLEHELVHLAMGELDPATHGRIPWWFHEGVAQMLTGTPLIERTADLADLARQGRLRLLAQLGRDETRSRRATDLAYQEAYSFARFLEDRFGPRVFARILQALRERTTMDRAVIAATGFSYITLESRWKELLSSGPWATMQRLAQQFFLVLLILALPLVVLALRRRFRREDEIEARWEEQETARTEGGPTEDGRRPE
jgi:hypothetical protein